MRNATLKDPILSVEWIYLRGIGENLTFKSTLFSKSVKKAYFISLEKEFRAA